jgi:predicted AAA+ superfamily ATPase
MKRTIEKDLITWKNKTDRKPLIILGVRHVGKTYTILEFGKSNFANVALFSFEGNEQLQKIFEKDLDLKRILSELQQISSIHLDENVLIFFDEIQCSNNALASLKNFYEQLPHIHIIAAGSLLSVVIRRGEYSFPADKVDQLIMHPMSFEEYLLALKEDMLCKVITNCYLNDSPMPGNQHLRSLQLYQEYLTVGGMPKAVIEYIETKDYDYPRLIQQQIMLDHLRDMSKYSTPTQSRRIKAV